MPFRRSPILQNLWQSTLCLAGVLVVSSAWAQGVAEQGFRIMAAGNQGNCLSCHTLPGQRELQSTFAPSLAGVATRYDAPALRQWVSDARRVKPDTLMPPFGTTQATQQAVRAQPILDDTQIADVVAALLTLR